MKLLVRVMGILLCIIMTGGCSHGWSVGSYQITPQDTVTNTAFVEIISHDSVQHWYANKVYNGENWCHLHDEWEYVEVK